MTLALQFYNLCLKWLSMRKPTPALIRFLNFVDKRGPDECWPWKGKPANSFGYGSFSFKSGSSIGAHRASYIIFYGSIPDGLSVLHKCDNPACVNPVHLMIGTQADNVHDCISKGRFPNNSKFIGGKKGDDHPRAKLTEKQVLDIRCRYIGVTGQLRSLADEFGVEIQSIWKIIKRKSWRHI